VATLEAEVAGMRIKPPSTGRDTTLMWLGVALLVAGVATSLGAYLMSHSTTNVLEQRDAMVASVCGIPLSIAGLALFLRYSLSGFLRFWIARLIALQSTAPTQGLSAGKRAE
jgi:ABC-type sulfate transport system permease component